MNLTGNTILITGGTSGIGRGLAEAFHARQNKVIIAGRRKQLLDEITKQNPGVEGLLLDVTDENSIETFVREVRKRYPKLNVLFNNAGISRPEDYTHHPVDTSTAHAILQTNVASVIEITAGLLPLLKAQPHATLLTTTSGLAFVPLAPHPVYSASKAFLHSWSDSLRHQLRNTSVEVLELIPPYVQTELGGPRQKVDPRAMPLAEFVSEVIQIIEQGNLDGGEILVERVKGLRHAEKNGKYAELLAAMGSF